MNPPKMSNLSQKNFLIENSFKTPVNSQKNVKAHQNLLSTKEQLDNKIPIERKTTEILPENKIINNEIVENELNLKEIKSNITMAENTDNDNNEENINDINYEENLRNKLNDLKNASNEELRRNCKEYYLISREWMKKLNDFIKGENNITLSELKIKKDNSDFLLEKEIINRALSYDQDKDKMIILKPIYAFNVLYKPCPINKPFWEMIHNTFKLELEIKEYAELTTTAENEQVYRRDYCKYFKINCVILPMKRYYKDELNIDKYDNSHINSVWPLPLDYLEGLKKDIQTFYFFSRKDTSIKNLIETIEKIVRKYPDLKLVPQNDYKCWIDLNYFDLEILLNLIKEKIKEIYNVYNINPSAPLELQKLEEEDSNDEIKGSNKFIFKLYPLKLFNQIELKEIFPNQFTDNFESINSKKLSDINNRLRDQENLSKTFDKFEIFKKFPEFTIIIEQGINSLFYKDDTNFNYKIGSCNFISCAKKTILTYYCECQKKFYCSSKCKEEDKRFHEDECQYSLSNYFISMSQQICRPFTKEYLGTKGIRNIGNTCYMSTALQCLSNCVELRNYFLFGSPKKDINKNNVLGYKGLVAYGFEYLIRKLWLDNEQVIDLGKFKRAMGLCNERFGGRSQQDTHEFVTFLIDSLHEDLNRVYNKIYIAKEERELSDKFKSKIEWNNFLRRNQSILVDLFYGLFKSSVICSVCNRSCVDFNTFSSISVNLKNTNKKQSDTEANKENKIDINTNINNNINNTVQKKEENKMEIETNEKDKNNSDKKEEINSKENINNNDIVIKDEKIGMINSPNKKEELLVGGKSNESDTSSDKKNENESNIKIPLIFFFYSLDEKPIQFMLPIKDKNEVSHKYLIYKISHILNKDPYSLCLYHISSSDRNITKIYGKNNFSAYDLSNLGNENKILFVCEISHDIIRNNLSNDINGIFYDSKIHNYLKEKKNTSREILEYNLNKNKENIKKCINDIITEKDIEKEKFEDKYLSNYYMDMNKVFQLTLKNFIIEQENKPKKYYQFPKILFFSKKTTIYELYFEIFKINKKIILEEQSDQVQILKEKFNSCFEKVLNVQNNALTEGPFFLCLQAYDMKLNKAENQKFLTLNEKEKNKSLEGIMKEMPLKNPDDIQYILQLYWDKKCSNNLKNELKPEKIDNLIDQDENKEKKQLLNESIDSTTKSSRGSTNEEIHRLQKERYNNLYDKYSNLNCAPPNGNNQSIKSTDNINENQENKKNEKAIPETNPPSTLTKPILNQPQNHTPENVKN